MMQRPGKSNCISEKSTRDGIVLVLAIIVLILSTSISISMIRTVSLRQRRFENRTHKLQANLLADSALERARQKLAAAETYTGETWTVETRSEKGEVTIQISENGSQEYDVNIVAAYPLDVPRRTQTSIQTTISLPAQTAR